MIHQDIEEFKKLRLKLDSLFNDLNEQARKYFVHEMVEAEKKFR